MPVNTCPPKAVLVSPKGPPHPAAPPPSPAESSGITKISDIIIVFERPSVIFLPATSCHPEGGTQESEDFVNSAIGLDNVE